MNRWLMNNRWLGGYLRNYRQGGGMTKRAKISTVLILWVSLVISAVLTEAGQLVLALLAAVGVGVTVHLAVVKAAPSSARNGRVEVNPKSKFAQRDDEFPLEENFKEIRSSNPTTRLAKKGTKKLMTA